MCKKILILLVLSILLNPILSFAKTTGFKVTNEMIYQKLIEIEKRQAVFEERFKQIDKRFEQIDKRFEESRADMNKRFEQVDKRFEDMNKRFEEQNQRIDQLVRLMGWVVGGMFGMLVVKVIILLKVIVMMMREILKQFHIHLIQIILMVMMLIMAGLQFQ